MSNAWNDITSVEQDERDRVVALRDELFEALRGKGWVTVRSLNLPHTPLSTVRMAKRFRKYFTIFEEEDVAAAYCFIALHPDLR